MFTHIKRFLNRKQDYIQISRYSTCFAGNLARISGGAAGPNDTILTYAAKRTSPVRDKEDIPHTITLPESHLFDSILIEGIRKEKVVWDGAGNPISIDELTDIWNERHEAREPERGEWLDTRIDHTNIDLIKKEDTKGLEFDSFSKFYWIENRIDPEFIRLLKKMYRRNERDPQSIIKHMREVSKQILNECILIPDDKPVLVERGFRHGLPTRLSELPEYSPTSNLWYLSPNNTTMWSKAYLWTDSKGTMIVCRDNYETRSKTGILKARKKYYELH